MTRFQLAVAMIGLAALWTVASVYATRWTVSAKHRLDCGSALPAEPHR